MHTYKEDYKPFEVNKRQLLNLNTSFWNLKCFTKICRLYYHDIRIHGIMDHDNYYDYYIGFSFLSL